MSKRKKLLRRIQNNPKDVSFEDLRKLLEWYGFELKRMKGSHCSFKGLVEGRWELLVIPEDQPLKPVYVKKALNLIERLENASGEIEDEQEGTDE
jgi:predicted RNA binding protein YcfA (HicA-like mRNA interferase family)